jgi:hypothetical protein
MRYTVSLFALVFISFVLSSCGFTRDAPAQPPDKGADMGNRKRPPAQSSAVPADLLERTKADAAQRAGKQSSEIEVVSAEAVTWRDASLGCPQPGMMSAQVLTPGYRIRLRAGGEEFDYHAGRGGRFVLCPAERAQSPAPSRGEN